MGHDHERRHRDQPSDALGPAWGAANHTSGADMNQEPKWSDPTIDALVAANTKLVGALDMVRETLNGGNVQDLVYIINTALEENRRAAAPQPES
jgi:hypothetical protein